MSPHLSNYYLMLTAFLTAVRGMLQQATAQKDLLVSRRMSAQLVDDLTAALAKFEQTLEATRAGRRDHVGASADLESVLSETPSRCGYSTGCAGAAADARV